MKKENFTCIALKFPFLSCVPLSYSPSLHSMPHLPQLSIVRCPSILHNTETNKIFLPILTSFFEIVITSGYLQLCRLVPARSLEPPCAFYYCVHFSLRRKLSILRSSTGARSCLLSFSRHFQH
jgi:hypothetical protein